LTPDLAAVPISFVSAALGREFEESAPTPVHPDVLGGTVAPPARSHGTVSRTTRRS
jgi:hypothetical protein